MSVLTRTVRATTALAFAGLTIACGGAFQPKPGTVKDEAMRAGRTASSFPAADEDYFHDMDGGLALTRDQIQGRNMWLVWTGGNLSLIHISEPTRQAEISYAVFC